MCPGLELAIFCPTVADGRNKAPPITPFENRIYVYVVSFRQPEAEYSPVIFRVFRQPNARSCVFRER